MSRSPKQLGEILFDEQNLPERQAQQEWLVGDRRQHPGGPRGPGSCAAGQDHGASADFKLKGTYTDALVRELDAKTGRAHLLSDDRGGDRPARFDGSQPAEHPGAHRGRVRKIRQAFIAEQGNKLLSADYSQIELRLLAHVADLASLKEAFARGDDIHAITASEMFGVPVKGMDPLVRRRAKAINFGIIYGISAFWPRQPARHRPAGGARIHRQVLPALSASATTWRRPRDMRARTAT
jgi:DNA polymerase-1